MPSFPTLMSFFITILIFANNVHATETIERSDLLSIFEKHQVTGTFALYDKTQDQLILVNPERAKIQMIPASTFKIANSLIALETGVIQDEKEIIPYGGKPQVFKKWEQDMSLRQAFKVSNVPIYLVLARRIGLENYQDWLEKLNYGNQELGQESGQNITTFWLKGPLKISAVEQTGFLSKLANTQLPISQITQRVVHDIAKIETKIATGGPRTLYGKTGWTITPNPQLGWFAGWVKSDTGTYSFALNIDIMARKDVAKREKITRAILAELGIF